MKIKFTKMQAFGNDYVYINTIDQTIDNLPKLAKYVSDRHFGIGSDGMVLICPSEKGDFRMRMFNPDGTEGEMCGNALRSVGKYVYDHGLTDKELLIIETLGGMQKLWLTVQDKQVVNITADIGEPRLDTAVIPVNTPFPEFVDQPVMVLDKKLNITALSWGNPHCVAFIEDVDHFDVHRYGRELEYMTELFPNKTNVTFAQIVSHDKIKIREWERGTGETIGCGTGCCTALVAGALTGRCGRKATIEQIGGPLYAEWEEETGHVKMTGPSYLVFESEIEIGHIV
ncbi:diaminopimelate epimerase [Anaerolentibacter hominis]|uniref:diaminopimelate epimerase n=1 Tax=Anaerolentibacter hominis TaxID=3079009 RepID=UPI0031B7FBC9